MRGTPAEGSHADSPAVRRLAGEARHRDAPGERTIAAETGAPDRWGAERGSGRGEDPRSGV